METMQMSKVHETTYNAVFAHPIARNLQWRDVRSMLSALTDVEEEHNGNLRFMRNGETLTVHPPKHKDLSDLNKRCGSHRDRLRFDKISPTAS
ncbi:MAG: hypothetical protein LH628_10975 [Microcoleus sp. CAN_BIN18]|nr:hypothetical protein [Microcoleus sp. CAN_BIN18]